MKCILCNTNNGKQWIGIKSGIIKCSKCYNKEYRLKNKEKETNRMRKWRAVNLERSRENNKKWVEKNKERKQDIDRNSYLKNKEIKKRRTRIYKYNKRRTDINFRISCNLRSRFKMALKNNAKKGSAIDNLGCSIEELKIHLESQFQKGMSWDNYGEWHIDHIQPLSKFELTEIKEIKKACNYLNLQPLWAVDNLSKGNR